jgi:glycosyltransferase involved in cell wall biosynthesis
MKLGIITGEYPPLRGGVGAYTHIMAGEWQKRGHELFLFAPPQAQDARAHLTPYAGKWGIGVVAPLRRWIATHKLDAVVLQSQMAMYNLSGVITALPSLVRNAPIVTTFHDLLPPYLFPKAGFLRGWAMRQLARTSAHAVVTNDEDLHALSGLPNVSLIPIGSNITAQSIAPEARQAYRQRVGGAFVVGHFGFLYPNRGVEVLLRALAVVRRAHDVRLVMIGGREGGPTNPAYVAELDALIATLGLSSAVHWTGYADDTAVSAWLQSVDCLALPFLDGASTRRGSLMAAIEHACPIVTTQPRVPIRAFVDGETMRLVPIGDPDALADALSAWASAPDALMPYRQQVATLRQAFQWHNIAEAFEAVFAKVRR